MSPESPSFDPWLRDLAREGSKPWAQGAPESFDKLLSLQDEWNLEDPYLWRYVRPQDVKQEVSESGEKVPDYWRGIARLLEAWNILNFWRARELARGCVELLNEREVLGPAIISRSLLEVMVAHLTNANRFNTIIQEALEQKAAFVSFVPIGKEDEVDLDKYLNRLVFGNTLRGRQRLPLEEEFTVGFDPFQPHHHFEVFKQNAQGDAEARLKDLYDELSQVSHPNFRGFARFLQGEGEEADGGGIHYTLTAGSDTEMADEIRHLSLEVLGFVGPTEEHAVLTAARPVKLLSETWGTGK